MTFKSILVLLIGCCAVPLSSYADIFEEAVSAHDSENFEQALSIFQSLSKENHAGAQFYLGHMIHFGEGRKSSEKKAAKLFIKAAEQGDNHARVALGYMYWAGNGVRQSDQKAFELFKIASDDEHQTGRYYLGRMYDGGFGVAESEQTAFNLYSQVLRMEGYPATITTDHYKNHLWNIDRKEPVDRWYKYKQEGMIETFTPESAAAKKAYDEEKRQHVAGFEQYNTKRLDGIQAALDTAVAEAGPIENAWAAYHEKEYIRALPIFLAHANNGDLLAQAHLGVLYRDGKGVEKNYETAAEWFNKAGENGSGEAYFHYANMAYNGHIKITNIYNNQFVIGGDAMKKSADLGYQPAIDYIKVAQERYQERLQAEKEEYNRMLQNQLQRDAEAAALWEKGRALREKKEFDDSMDDIRLGRCRNPRYSSYGGRNMVTCD